MNANSDTQPPRQPSVTVTGQATASGAPDIGRIRLALLASAPTVGEAVAASSVAVGKVRAALDAHGIGVADTPSGRITIAAQEQWENNKSVVTGDATEHHITVTVHDLHVLGAVLGDVVAAAGDATRLHGVDFLVADDAGLHAQARDLAFADAQGTAQHYAGLAGRQLGAVLEIAESSGGGPSPMPKARALAAMAADSMPVEPGAVDAGATVTVTWALD